MMLENTIRRSRRIIESIRPVWWGILFLGAVTFFMVNTASSFHIFVFNSILLTVMGAIALQVLQGTTGLFSVGNAAFLMVGALSAVFSLGVGIKFPFDLISAALFTGLCGFIVGLPALRLKGLFLIFSTLAAHFIFFFFASRYQGLKTETAAAGFSVRMLFSSYPENISQYWAWMLFGIVSIVLLGATRIVRERSGRALRMIREHEHIAPTLGIPVAKYKLQIFVISSMLLGFQGALIPHLNGVVSIDNFPITLAFSYILIIVIGGLDSIAGAFIGSVVIIGLPILVPTLVKFVKPEGLDPTVGSNISLMLYGVIVIFFVVVSPQGIMGVLRSLTNKTKSVWASRSKQ